VHNGVVASDGSAAPWVLATYWGAVGGLVAFGVAGLATIGLFLLALAAVLVAVGFVVPALRRPSVPGFLVGLSAAPLYIAWLNRGGPGTVCTTDGTTTSCADAWSPWPFVATGVLLAGGGLGLLATRRRRSRPVSGPAVPTVGPAPRT
jgi:hypothetical protein